MYAYVARQPILNKEQQVIAYELLFRNGERNEFPQIDPDAATSLILIENQLNLGMEKITGDLPAYINFHADTIIKNFPTFLDPKKVVVEILETVDVNMALILACKKLKKQGFQLALDDHDFDPKWDILMPYIDMLKIDVCQFNILQISKLIRKTPNKNMILLAEKVETLQQFEQLKTLGFTLFQGYFFAKPEMLKQKKLSPTKQNILDLITEASKEKIDLDIINNIFTKDIGLSYKLLRFINSPGYGCAQEITSLKHALIYIGDLELKKFIALLALANLNESKPDEIIRISLVRAKFCELVSNIKQDAANPPKAFLTGMLSLIDGMLDFDLELLLTLLPIHADIKMALLGKEHYLTRYLALSIAIEIGDWSRAHELCELIGVELDEICESYQEAVFWADNMLLGTI